MKLILILLMVVGLNAKHLHKESHYQKIFCDKIGGVEEFVLYDKSRVDCLDIKGGYAWESDFENKIYEAIGQSLYYAEVTGLKPAIHLIVKDCHSRYVHKLRIVAKKYDIKIYLDKE